MTDYEAAKKQFDADLKEYNLLAAELRQVADKFLDYERQLGTLSETTPAFPVRHNWELYQYLNIKYAYTIITAYELFITRSLVRSCANVCWRT